jgi:hypothetical protein
MELGISDFKAHLFEILDKLEQTNDEITLLRNGKRKYKVLLISQDTPPAKFGCLKGLYKIDKNVDFTEPMDKNSALPRKNK